MGGGRYLGRVGGRYLGQDVGTSDRGRGRYLGWGGRYLGQGVGSRYLGGG